MALGRKLRLLASKYHHVRIPTLIFEKLHCACQTSGHRQAIKLPTAIRREIFETVFLAKRLRILLAGKASCEAMWWHSPLANKAKVSKAFKQRTSCCQSGVVRQPYQECVHHGKVGLTIGMHFEESPIHP